MFCEEHQRTLLALARKAIATALTDNRLLDLPTVDEALRRKYGAFVTLTLAGRLRGCIGYPEPVFPLHETIARGAVAAALHDPRFPPVTPEELLGLHIEISILSPLMPVTPEQVEVGVHGLVIEQGRARGLLLPQVPVEWGWSREEYLSHLCRKANLPTDAWRNGAILYAFTAHVFAESTVAARPDAVEV
jgi:conserved hypothetical protein TIGR00296